MKKIVAVIAVIAAAGLGFGALYFTNPLITSSGTPESIIVGGPALEQSAFIYVAQDQGFLPAMA